MSLTAGRLEVCKNTIGGVRAIYLADFIKYPKNEIKLSKDKTTLESFPVTIIYQVELRSETSYNQEIQEDGTINQNLEVALKKDSLQTMQEVRTLTKKELRVIVEDRMGQYWMMGLHNGVTIESYSRNTGNAKGDFNGYNLNFSGLENHISPLITNLADIGFIIDPVQTIWRASNTTITADNSNKLVSELFL